MVFTPVANTWKGISIQTVSTPWRPTVRPVRGVPQVTIESDRGGMNFTDSRVGIATVPR